MDILVGYTGFVGSNIEKQRAFDALYNSGNIEKAFGTRPDLCVYSGVPAEKFLANKEPEKDKNVIENAINNIKQINPRFLVLISTVDVYQNPFDVDEDTIISEESSQAYGKNRYYLENWVRDNLNDFIIVRLPALFGLNLKKNFIYDLINIIPAMLNSSKFEELKSINPDLESFYKLQLNGFYKCRDLLGHEREYLKQFFEDNGFTAVNFTDSRAIYQFYYLNYIWNHINVAIKHKIHLINLATEPLSAKQIYEYVTGKTFENEILQNVPYYNFRTKHYEIFEGNNGYLFGKAKVLSDIKKFTNNITE